MIFRIERQAFCLSDEGQNNVNESNQNVFNKQNDKCLHSLTIRIYLIWWLNYYAAYKIIYEHTHAHTLSKNLKIKSRNNKRKKKCFVL